MYTIDPTEILMGRVPCSNFTHILPRQMGIGIEITGLLRCSMAAFGHHLVHVLPVSTQPKMCNVDTRRYIAVVQHFQMIGRLPFLKPPRCTVGHNIFAKQAKAAIPI